MHVAVDSHAERTPYALDTIQGVKSYVGASQAGRRYQVAPPISRFR